MLKGKKEEKTEEEKTNILKTKQKRLQKERERKKKDNKKTNQKKPGIYALAKAHNYTLGPVSQKFLQRCL